MTTKIKMLAGFALGAFLFAMAGIASATPFTQTKDFFSYKSNGDLLDYIALDDSDSTNLPGGIYTYTHTLPPEFTTPPHILLDATLTLRHTSNSDSETGAGEIWFSSAENNPTDILIGRLSNSTDANAWEEQSWTLGTDILNLMANSSPWELTINLYDTTRGTDKIEIDWSTLAGNYTPGEIDDEESPTIDTSPVPEPATMLLLGTGLVGVAGAVRRRKNKLA